MDDTVWEELLGGLAKWVRGVLLFSTVGQILKSTLPLDDVFDLDTRSIANTVAGRTRLADLRTDDGGILVAPLNKEQVLVILVQSVPGIRFKLDLVKLYGGSGTLP